MSDFFDNLGAAAKRTAGKVNTQVAIAAQEQKAKDAYQILGKLYYQAIQAGAAPEGPDFDRAIAQAKNALDRINQLRAQENVAPENPQSNG